MKSQQVKELRQRHKLSQEQLGTLCWCSGRTVRRWEQEGAIDPARFELAALKIDDKTAQQQFAEWAQSRG